MIRIDKIQIDDVQLECDDECEYLEDDKSKKHSKQKIILNLSDFVFVKDNPRQFIFVLRCPNEAVVRFFNKCLEALYWVSAAKRLDVIITSLVEIHNVFLNFLRQQLFNDLIYLNETFHIVDVSVTRLYCKF